MGGDGDSFPCACVEWRLSRTPPPAPPRPRAAPSARTLSLAPQLLSRDKFRFFVALDVEVIN